MWIFLNDAFLSIVDKDCARDELLVRSRRRGDIEKLFPGANVGATNGLHNDYAYRAVVKRQHLAEVLILEVSRISYPNFKESVADARLHDAYLKVWQSMYSLQHPLRFPQAAPKHRRPRRKK